MSYRQEIVGGYFLLARPVDDDRKFFTGWTTPSALAKIFLTRMCAISLRFFCTNIKS